MKILNKFKKYLFTFAFAIFGFVLVGSTNVGATAFTLSDGSTSQITSGEGQLLYDSSYLVYIQNQSSNYMITLISRWNYTNEIYNGCTYSSSNNRLSCSRSFSTVTPNYTSFSSTSINTSKTYFVVGSDNLSLYAPNSFGISSPVYTYNINSSYNQDDLDNAYDEGYRVGENAGLETGYNNGYSAGESAGLTTGYNNGYSAGESAGLETGYNNGYSAGESAGYSSGYNEGREVGFESGLIEGQHRGYDTGYSAGYVDGYGVGESTGYDEGYWVGLESNNTLTGLVGAVFTGPVTLLTSIFDFEFLGINLSGLILSLTTLLVVVWLVKKFI